ncbi:ABC transporter permease [Streptomyces sp. NPDC049837]|uniref:ABC transporter permease n=1 Tax=Streptomyces sp. NPDC049837 TaxID=3155277 RepID=UPI003447F4D1
MSSLTTARTDRARTHRVAARQHRRALWVTLALLALAAAVTAGLRWWVAGSMDEARCFMGEAEACGKQLFGTWKTPQGVLALVLERSLFVLMAVPPLIGAFVAGPVLARELESGTYKVAWAQSATPARWLASKLVLAAALAATTATVLTAVFRFGRVPVRYEPNLSWSDLGAYELMGPALGAYCLLGVAVGALVGLLVRRTVAAMATTAAVIGTVLLGFGSLRWELWPSVHASGRGADLALGLSDLPPDVLLLRSGYVTTDGQRLHPDTCLQPSGDTRCPPDVTGWYADYHPASHFWPLQLVETGIVLALAALATLLAFRVLRRRHA